MSGRVSYNFFTAFNSFFNSQVLVMQKKEKGWPTNLHCRSFLVKNLPLRYPRLSLFFFLSYSNLVG